MKSKLQRADNVYRFVDRLVSSNFPRESIVNYRVGPKTLTPALQTQLRECMKFTQNLMSYLEEMKKQRDEARKELTSTQVTLREALDKITLFFKVTIIFKS